MRDVCSWQVQRLTRRRRMHRMRKWDVCPAREYHLVSVRALPERNLFTRGSQLMSAVRSWDLFSANGGYILFDMSHELTLSRWERELDELWMQCWIYGQQCCW